jgi:hypothetical protein
LVQTLDPLAEVPYATYLIAFERAPSRSVVRALAFGELPINEYKLLAELGL